MKKMIMALLTVAISHTAMARDCKDSDSFTKIIDGKAEVSRHILVSSGDYNILYKGMIKSVSMDKDTGRYGDYNEYRNSADQENHTMRLGRYILVAGNFESIDLDQNQKGEGVRTTGDTINMSMPGIYYASSLSLKVYRSSGDFRATEKITIASVKYNLGDKVKLSELKCED